MEWVPEISAVQRFTYEPGDRFIIRMANDLYSRDECEDIARSFKRYLNLPDDAPVVVTDASIDIEIVRPG